MIEWLPNGYQIEQTCIPPFNTSYYLASITRVLSQSLMVNRIMG